MHSAIGLGRSEKCSFIYSITQFGPTIDGSDSYSGLVLNRTVNFSLWLRGIAVIASAYKTEDHGFEIPQGCNVFQVLYIAVLLLKLNIHCHRVYLR
jgi:hypothetical protein